ELRMKTGWCPARRLTRPTVAQLHANGRLFPPNYLHESWQDYLYWDTEVDLCPSLRPPRRAMAASQTEMTAFHPASEIPSMRIAASSQPMTGSLLSVGMPRETSPVHVSGTGHNPHSTPA